MNVTRLPFDQWLAGQAGDPSTVGDLARHTAACLRTGCLTADATPAELRQHLTRMHGGRLLPAVELAERAFLGLSLVSGRTS